MLIISELIFCHVVRQISYFINQVLSLLAEPKLITPIGKT